MEQETVPVMPDMDAYAERIGTRIPAEPSLEGLTRAILDHQMNVPFENIQCYDERSVPPVDIGSLFDKVVMHRRGGYCFELNTLFLAYFRGCGYDAWPVSCCVLRGKDFVPPMLHRASLVRLDGIVYYCDVGYGGPQPAGPVPLGGSATPQGESFTVRKDDFPWWVLSRVTSRGSTEDVVGFWDFPVGERHFIPYNHYCATCEDSVFVQRRMLNLRTPGGSLALTGDTLTVREGHDARAERYPDRESLAGAISDIFGIDIPPSILRMRPAPACNMGPHCSMLPS